MSWASVLASFWLLSLAAATGAISPGQFGGKEWWKNAAIYQIYPLSFRDSDNDGRGDLRGIIEKIPHLKETGFDAVWLSPIYASPMIDFGYDISNFTKIHEWYGTMEDFDELTGKLHDSGMRLIMDFVPNHSSDRHEWFERSVRREPGYEDYYVWKDPKGFDADGRPLPPNNWLSVFHGSAWTYNQDRKQFYLHHFASAQPDLNYSNPKVVEEMTDVIRFWLEKGADGFRVDAVPFLLEDPSFRDEPPARDLVDDPLDFEQLHHVYTQNQPGTYKLVRQWRSLFDRVNSFDGEDRCFMVEAYAGVEDTMKYFGTERRPGAHFPFNFNLLAANNGTAAADMKQMIDAWLDNLPESGHPNWLLGNHDQHRVGSRVGADFIDEMNAINLLLPGTSVVYYGEEIGMLDNEDIAFEDGVDPQGCNHPREEFRRRSRDFERTPFQWDATPNAGFNAGNKTWLPVNENYKTLNLEAQRRQAYSHYAIFTDLMKARKTKAVRDGTLLLRVVGRGTLGFVRMGCEEMVVVLINFSRDDDAIDLQSELVPSEEGLHVVTTDVGSGYEKGSKIGRGRVNLRGRSFLVLAREPSRVLPTAPERLSESAQERRVEESTSEASDYEGKS